jgi:hypothetical protein
MEKQPCPDQSDCHARWSLHKERFDRNYFDFPNTN